MKLRRPAIKKQILALLVLSIALIWIGAVLEIYLGYRSALHEGETRTTNEAQVFSEWSRSTLKRINEFILYARSDWKGDAGAFATVVRRS